MKPITGNVAECLKHLADSALSPVTGKSLKEDYEFRDRLGSLLGINPQLAYRWFACDTVPTGFNLIKLIFLLETIGYQLEGREQMTPIQKELLRQFALGVVTREAISERFEVIMDTVNGWALKRDYLGAASAAALETLLSNTSTVADLAQQKLESGLVRLELISPKGASYSTESVGDTPRDEVVKKLAGLILQALPLATRLASDEFSATDRASLRQLATQGRSAGVFELSNVMFKLCSERSRNSGS